MVITRQECMISKYLSDCRLNRGRVCFWRALRRYCGMRLRLTCIIFCLVFGTLTGCGRFAPPFPPEKVAPQAVNELTAVGTEKGILFKWTTPESDRRDKPLRFIDGFSVHRKDILTNKDVTNDDIPFTLLAEIPDKAIEDRERRKEEAKNIGAISRRVKLDPLLSAHEYEDVTVETGKSYIYKIVPTNQGGVEGEVRQFVSVTFRGLTSDIAFPNAKELGVDDFLSQPPETTP